MNLFNNFAEQKNKLAYHNMKPIIIFISCNLLYDFIQSYEFKQVPLTGIITEQRNTLFGIPFHKVFDDDIFVVHGEIV